MDSRTISVAAICASLLASCAPLTPNTLTAALHACQAGASHVEMHDNGTVVRVLGMRNSQSGMHEGFLVVIPFRAANGALTQGVSRVWKVEDNTDITGPIPLRAGDRIELQGQYECNDGVIHWTHRDPRGRHIAGYIKVHGQTYQ